MLTTLDFSNLLEPYNPVYKPRGNREASVHYFIVSDTKVDRTLRCQMEEISAMDENAMPPTTKLTKKKQPVEWTVKKYTPIDSPASNWNDTGCQYTVKSPSNFRNILLRMSVFHGGRPTKSCGFYLHEEREDDICLCLLDLLTRLENMWLNSHTGVPKPSRVTRTMSSLPTWH